MNYIYAYMCIHLIYILYIFYIYRERERESYHESEKVKKQFY